MTKITQQTVHRKKLLKQSKIDKVKPGTVLRVEHGSEHYPEGQILVKTSDPEHPLLTLPTGELHDNKLENGLTFEVMPIEAIQLNVKN